MAPAAIPRSGCWPAGLEQLLREQGLTWVELLDRASAQASQRAGEVHRSPRAPETGGDPATLMWRAAVEPAGPGSLARRLSWLGLTESDIPEVLALRTRPGRATRPAWLADLEQLCAASGTLVPAASPGSGPSPDGPPPGWLERLEARLSPGSTTGRDAVPFAALFVGFLDVAACWAGLPCDGSAAEPDLRASLQLGLLRRLSEVADRALLADFGRSRTVGENLMLALGPAPGRVSARAAYQDWIWGHHQECLAGLLTEYPVLGRLWAVVSRQWATQVRLLLARTQHDRPELEHTFGIPAALPLTTAQWGLSDPHRGGRTVVVLDFGAGPQRRRVVYKPKDLRLDRWFSSLVDEVATCLDRPGWHAPAVLCCREPAGDPEPPGSSGPNSSHYGYVQYVEHRPARSPAELSQFYRHAGALLGLLHLLGATDCHFENLIAAGSCLVLVDVETLFDSPVHGLGPEAAGPAAGLPPPGLRESVLRTGMLPRWEVIGGDRTVVEVSALGVVLQPGTAGPQWVATNTDDMALALPAATASVGGIPQELAACSPWPAAGEADLGRHVADVVAGYCEIYRWAMLPDNRDRLDARLAECIGLRRRVVLRATRIYSVLTREACSPAALADADARGLGLERLARAPVLGRERGGPLVLRSELIDIEQADIPYFDHRLGDQALVGSAGPILGVLADDGLRAARDRLRGLTERDLELQVRVIRGAFAARITGADQPRSVGPPRATAERVHAEARVHPLQPDPLQYARAIRARLIAAELPDPGAAPQWLALGAIPGSSMLQLGLAGDGLYDGRAGMSLFLDACRSSKAAEIASGWGGGERLDRVGPPTPTDPRRQQDGDDWAQRTAAPLLGLLCAEDEAIARRYLRDQPLGYCGIGGLLRYLLHPGPVSARSAEHDLALDRVVAALTVARLAADSEYDFISGVAGLIGPLLAVLGCRPSAHVTDLLHAAAGGLVASQQADGGWRPRGLPQALAGYSHGASGIATPLARAGAALGSDRYISAAAAGIAFETAHFDRRRNVWPDLRGRQPGLEDAWCHGAAGIALARMQLLGLVDTHPDAPKWLADLERAIRITVSPQLGPQDQLCCGNMGRAATLMILGRQLGRPELLTAGTDLAMRTAARAARGAGYALTVGPDGPGLMSGLSGIGLLLASIGADWDLSPWLL